VDSIMNLTALKKVIRKKKKKATIANNGIYKKLVVNMSNHKNLEYSNSRFYIHKMIQLTLKLLTIL
jgi:hypothetical protein